MYFWAQSMTESNYIDAEDLKISVKQEILS